jgi:hypothetical protein
MRLPTQWRKSGLAVLALIVTLVTLEISVYTQLQVTWRGPRQPALMPHRRAIQVRWDARAQPSAG